LHHSKIDRPMSALGHKRTYAVQNGMSALLPIATAKADFVVNLQTAKALGLSIRESFLLLADEVIE
jgi:hypothetical protein